MKLSKIKNFSFLAILAVGLLVGTPHTQAQDFFSPPEPPPPVMEPQEDYQKDFLETPQEEPLTESVEEVFTEPPTDAPVKNQDPGFQKKMVQVPPAPLNQRLDAGDFRDPFFYVRGYQPNASRVLKPGTTIDGARFNAYRDSNGFIENYYRDSNFVLEDVFGKIQLENREGGCLTCHRGIEKISNNHAFRCTRCHSGSSRGKTMEQAHEGMVSNPSDLEHAPVYCGKCHEEQIQKTKSSLMATNRGLIEITRHAWGAPHLEQPKPVAKKAPSKKTAKEDTQEDVLAPDTWTYTSQDHRVDDFLEKKCMRCHLQSPAPHRAGDYRATGCAACHMVYTNDGLTLSRDRAIQKKQKENLKQHHNRFDPKSAANSLKNPRAYPLVHQFTVAIPSVQCEHCHNNNGVGNEFEGLFGKPARPKPVREVVDDNQPVLYGRQHEFLVPDIHREKGMHCIDCHNSEEVKSDSTLNASLHEAMQIRCETCHGTNGTAPDRYQLVEADPKAVELLAKNKLNPNLARKVRMGDVVMAGPRGAPPLAHVVNRKGEWILYSKVTGKPHKIPILKGMKRMPLPHQVAKHMIKVECSACHARWSASEWGLHAIREDSLNPEQWKDWNFSDPTLQQLMTSTNPAEPNPQEKGMLNWRTAKQQTNDIVGLWKPGLWRNVFTESAWDTLLLGKNKRGKYSILKPRYQYFITDPEGEEGNSWRARVPLTSNGSPGLILTPHTPHTVRKEARTCESCHQNTIAAGWGDPNLWKVMKGKPFLDALRKENRLLPEFQIKQSVSANGVPLQIVLPGKKTRTLNYKEIKSLFKVDDKFKAYRYIDLRSQRRPRLLVRGSLPFDEKHQKNDAAYGPPVEEEELLYYDLNQKKFYSQIPESSTTNGNFSQPEQEESDPPIQDFFKNLFGNESPSEPSETQP